MALPLPAIAQVDDARWKEDNDRGNRYEGLVKIPIANPDLELMSFLVGQVAPFSNDGTLKVRFFVPDSRTVHIYGRELRDRKHYWMEAKPRAWTAGAWGEFAPWPVQDVLGPEGITADNLGLTIHLGEESENYLIPALLYLDHMFPPITVTNYTLYLRSDQTLKEVTYTLFRDDAKATQLGPPKLIPGSFDADFLFAVPLPGGTALPEGPIRLVIEGAYRNRVGGPKRIYRFFHKSRIG